MDASLSVDVNVTPLFEIYVAHSFYEDTNLWTVWLGWHPVERISTGPKDRLNLVRNQEWSARAKVCLIVILLNEVANAKAWSSEPLCSSLMGARDD